MPKLLHFFVFDVYAGSTIISNEMLPFQFSLKYLVCCISIPAGEHIPLGYTSIS
jgi:hypothetical protein